jgi:hypothetical protein
MDESKNPQIEIEQRIENQPSSIQKNEVSVPEIETTPQIVENEQTRFGLEEEIRALSNENSSRVNEKGMIIVEEAVTKINNPSNVMADELLKNLTK